MMQFITFVMYVLAVALTAGVLFWAGERILAGRRARKRRLRQRPAASSVAGEHTQYSMFTELPTEDDAEYDPLAEADIYLTYGNRQMALETLTRAAQAHPEREDIRNRLAGLQHSDNS